LAFARDVTKGIEFRVSQLNALYRCIDENRDVLVNAVNQDFRKVSLKVISNLI
jgi:hypothetical protein